MMCLFSACQTLIFVTVIILLSCDLLCSSTNPSIEHSLKLTSAYSHYLKESGQPEITTCHSRTAITVDYIFYSAALGDAMAQAGLTITLLFSFLGNTQ